MGMTARDDFATALAQYKEMPSTFFTQKEMLNEEYRAAILQAALPFVKPKARAKLSFDKAYKDLAAMDLLNETTEPFRLRAEAIEKDYKERRDILKTALDALAPEAEIRKGDFWVPFSQHFASTYSTQGMGANSYAKAAAQLDTLIIKHFGIEVTVVEEPGQTSQGHHGSFTYGDGYVVACLVESEVDVAIMKHRPAMSLRDWLKACWASGTNPRVLNPFIPEGLEEKLGIDYFGRDVPQRTT